MKTYVTRKQLKNYFGNSIYRAGYCSLYPLFSSSDARFYNHGVYGWNFDVVVLYNDCGQSIAITTGYRNMFGQELPERCKKIIKNAKKYIANSPSYEQNFKYLNQARKKFIKALSSVTTYAGFAEVVANSEGEPVSKGA